MKKFIIVLIAIFFSTFNLVDAGYGRSKINFKIEIGSGGSCAHRCYGHVYYQPRRVYDRCGRYRIVKIRQVYYCPPPIPRPRCRY